MRIKIKGFGLGKFAGDRLTIKEEYEIAKAARRAEAKLHKIEFISEALVGVAKDISDCFDKRDLKCLEKAVVELKEDIEFAAKEAPENIRRRYLPLILKELAVCLEETEDDVEKYGWEVADDNYRVCLDNILTYLCLAYEEV